MVYYIAATGAGVDQYGETKWDVLDMPASEISRRARYAHPELVPAHALGDDVAKLEQGFWLDPDTLPKKILWESGNRPVPDVLPRFVVSRRFREGVERFEPGLHQFVPVQVYKARNSDPVEEYYWFIIGQRLDSVDRAHTTYEWRPRKGDENSGSWIKEKIDPESLEFIPIPNAKLVFSLAKTAGHHLWRDPHILTGGDRLCSDEFAAALGKAGLTGVGSRQREAV